VLWLRIRMLPDCLPWLGVLGEWTNPLWLGVCKRLSKHLQWTQCHIERLCIRDYCRTQHFDRPDLWNMSGKIAVGGGIPKAILSRSSAALRAPLIFARSFLERVPRKFKTRLRRTMPMLSTFTTSQSKRSCLAIKLDDRRSLNRHDDCLPGNVPHMVG